MKHKLLFLFFFLLGFTQVYSQSVNLEITGTDGVKKNVDITALRNMTFGSALLNLNYWNGTFESISTKTIANMLFKTSTGFSNLKSNKNDIIAYPNPATNFILLKNLSEDVRNVAVYNVTGEQVLNIKQLSKSQPIQVSLLQKGLYFLKINNQTIKFIKQ
ncbi:MAG: T9SS type A sorting domain-containing protein [Paludibacteraceae bacterium]